MIQCFRFMGMPDKVLAFDELPERFITGFELCRAEGFPKHWKEWLGKIKKITKIPPEKDFLTGGVRRFDPIVEEDSFFYLVDWNLKQNEEKWQELSNYVKQVVSKDVRLMDKLDDMAKPLAENKTDGVSLDPADVVVIPIPPEIPTLVNVNNVEVKPTEKKEKESTTKCGEPGCKFETSGSYAKGALRMHISKKHKKEVVHA